MHAWTILHACQILTQPGSGPGMELTLDEQTDAEFLPRKVALISSSVLSGGTSISSTHGFFLECSPGAQGCPKVFLHICLYLNPSFPQIFPMLDSYFRPSSRPPPQRFSPTSLSKLPSPHPWSPVTHPFMFITPSPSKITFYLLQICLVCLFCAL